MNEIKYLDLSNPPERDMDFGGWEFQETLVLWHPEGRYEVDMEKMPG